MSDYHDDFIDEQGRRHAQSDEMMCSWRSWTVVGPRHLRVFLADGDCTHAPGVIAVATRLMPDVRFISTVSGDTLDTFYELSPNGWRSCLFGAKRGHVDVRQDR